MLPTLDVAGSQTRFIDIANRLEPQFEHILIALDGQREALVRLAETVKRQVLNAPPLTGLSLAPRLRACAQMIAANRPDILLTYNWGAIEFALANLFTGVTHIHAEDGFGPDEANSQLLRRVWTRRIALRRSFVVVPSSILAGLARKTWWIPARKLHWIRNGIDLEKFKPRSQSASRAAIGLPNGLYVVGWVGALRPEKNVPRLLRAFAILPGPSRLVLVGEGSERARLEKLAADLGIGERVAFLGSRRDVSDILPAFDVLALSSDTEQMPVVVMEAMAAGLPVASVDVGDVRMMLSVENLPLVTARSEEALGIALASLATNRELRTTIARANRAAAQERFDLGRMVAAHTSLYLHALGRPAGAAGNP